MFSDKECKYEKLLFIITVIILTIVVSACGNESKEILNNLNVNIKKFIKNNTVEKVMDKIPLKELDNLSKTDTTDKNKKNFVHFSRILITI